MKTYLLDTFNKYKRYSDKLDAQTILSNRCWWVFNDSGEKETYIFREDGSIIITLAGAVTYGKWEYIAANQSIIISGNKQAVMVHPTFVDGVILALQVDGTETFAFLIDEQNKAKFKPTTYTEVVGYFEEKERKALAEEEEAKNAIIEIAKLKKEEEDRKAEEEKKLKYKQAADDFHRIGASSMLLLIILFIIGSLYFLFYLSDSNIFFFKESNFALFFIVPLTVISIFAIAGVIFLIFDRHKKSSIRKYILEHPDDPMNPYLKEYLK